jgi:transposase
MFLRRCRRRSGGRETIYWELVESYRTERGPRQRVVASLGRADLRKRRGVVLAASERDSVRQLELFEEDLQEEWEQVDTRRVVTERARDFGAWWLALRLGRLTGLCEFLRDHLPAGREDVPWWVAALVLVLCRFCDPSSELGIAGHVYRRSALEDLLGVPATRINDDRLYRALDRLLPHKSELEKHLKDRLGELFSLEYDLLLYDMTSTYFEGACAGNAQAQRGYSRDHRGDCKQVTIALVVSRCGMPLGYEVFDGNRADVTTTQEIVGKIEAAYGVADRIWVMDRGMVSEANLSFLRQSGRRYIVGTPRVHLRRFEHDLLREGWQSIRDGLEVKTCSSADASETFILCRSADRRQKEQAIHARFEQRLDAGLAKLEAWCATARRTAEEVNRRVGRLLALNARSAGLYQVQVVPRAEGGSTLRWTKSEEWRAWSELSDGCYLLRTNIGEWSAGCLWEAYTQLTQAEAAFRIQKSDLRIRPVWHQKTERVQAHILVCFLAFVLWKTLAQACRTSGLGDEPRKVLDEIAQIKLVDVVLTTQEGTQIRRRCVVKPEPHQAVLLHKLGLRLPKQLRTTEM